LRFPAKLAPDLADWSFVELMPWKAIVRRLLGSMFGTGQILIEKSYNSLGKILIT
jgi:hypothetical protein